MFDTKSLSKNIEIFILSNIVKDVKRIIGDVLIEYAVEYAQTRENMFTALGVRVKLSYEEKQKIGMILVDMVQKGSKAVLTSENSKLKIANGVFVRNSDSGVEYKIPLTTIIEHMVYQEVEGDINKAVLLIPQDQGYEDVQLSKVYDLFVKGTQKQVFEDVLSSYVESSDFVNKVTERLNLFFTK